MLLDYNYEIVYRPGEDQEAADFLSRNAVDEIQAEEAEEAEDAEESRKKNLDFEDYSKTEIREYQDDDKMCQDIAKKKGEIADMDGNKVGILKRYEGTFIEDDDKILWKRKKAEINC